MKKVIGMLAVVAFANSMASAELLKNFKADGQVDVHAYSVNNTDFNKGNSDKTANTDTRVMINAGFDLNEDVNAVVSVVKNNQQYGAATRPESAQTILNQFFFQQAYLNLKNVFGIDHKLGRQYYGNAGDMVVYYGPATMPYTAKFAPSIAAIDGWTGWYKFNVLNRDWNVNAIIAKQAMGTPYPSKDINVTGINAKTNVDRWNLNAYYYQKVDQTAAKADYLDIAGARANWECMFVKNLNIGLEYDMNMGRNRFLATDYKGYAYKANVDYSMDLKGKLAFSGEYAAQSGDKNLTDKNDKAFQAINSDYRPGIIMGSGFVGGAIWTAGTGLTNYNVGANWTPEKLNKLNVAAKYYNFANAEKNTAADKHLGNEIDAMATWTHSASVSVNGYYAMFSPEKKNLGVGVKHDTENMMGANFNVKF